MTIEVRVPQLPESVADATLVSWHKKPGDAVARDENLVDLETDKVVLEVPAPAARGARAPAIMAAPSGVTTSAQEASGAKSPASGAPAAAKLSPAAKRVVEENKLDPNAVLGSGRDGRVSKSDVVNYLSAKDATPQVVQAPAPAAKTQSPAGAPAQIP